MSKLVKTVLVVFIPLFISCNHHKNAFFDIKYDEVDKIVLHWEEHHYNNEAADDIVLDRQKVWRFISEFNNVVESNEEGNFEHNCFQLHIYYWDGIVDKYLFDGHYVQSLQNHHYYKLNEEDNLISKYWGLTERDFCIKSH